MTSGKEPALRLPNPMMFVVWPAFLLPARLWGWESERAFAGAVFLLACAVLSSMPSPWEARRTSRQTVVFFLLLECLYLISYLYSMAFNGVSTGVRDFGELARYLLLGTFAVYVIRHYDGSARRATEAAMTAALYVSLFLPANAGFGYVSTMTLCYLLFFSRARLRLLHSVAALLVVWIAGVPSLTAAWFVVSAALAFRLHQELSRRGLRFAARSSLAAFVLLLALPLAWFSSTSRARPAAEIRQIIRRSPVFGWGPAQYELMPSVENQYLFWTLRGGALGAGLILLGLAFACFFLLRSASGDPERLVGAAAFLASVALMLAAGRFLESYQGFLVTAFLMAGMHQACAGEA